MNSENFEAAELPVENKGRLRCMVCGKIYGTFEGEGISDGICSDTCSVKLGNADPEYQDKVEKFHRVADPKIDKMKQGLAAEIYQELQQMINDPAVNLEMVVKKIKEASFIILQIKLVFNIQLGPEPARPEVMEYINLIKTAFKLDEVV